MERGGTLMPNGEPPPSGGGESSLDASAKAAREGLEGAIRGLGPEADQQVGLPGRPDPMGDKLAERALGDLEGVKPGGSRREKQGFFRRAAGKVGRTPGDIAGGIGGAVGEAAGWVGQAISSGELKQAVGIGLRHWVENLNPKNIVDKDWLWRLGFGFGAIESVAFTALPLPLKGFAKAGLNLAITQGIHIALNLPRAREEARVQKQPTIGEEMTRIAEKYSRAHQRIKDFALGLSAGAMYLSLGSIVSEVGKEALGWNLQAALQDRFEPGKGAPATATATPTPSPSPEPSPAPARAPAPVSSLEPTAEPSPTAAPTVSPAPTPSPAATPGALEPGPSLPGRLAQTGPDIGEPPPAVPPPSPGLAEMPSAAAQAAKEQAIRAISDNPDYALAKAEEVGKVLPNMQDDIVQKVLEQNNGSLSDLDATALEKTHQAIQHALEGKANTFFDNNLNANPSTGLQGVSEAGRTSFESWLASDAAHTQLAEVAQKAITEQVQVMDVLTQNVSTALETAPNLFTDQAIAHGTNVGQMLQDAGYQVTWTGADAPMLGAHIAANNDMLTEMWHNMAAHQNIPESPFPVGLTELNDLVAKAQVGDKEALRKLLAALRFIPAGQKFRILNKEGISAVLGALG